MCIWGDRRRSGAAQNSGGLTLVEIMVAMGLLATSLMLVLALIPAGIRSAQQAEETQAAAAWSRQLLETAPVPENFPIAAELARSEHEQIIGQAKFQATRRLSTVAGEKFLYRIEVETIWPGRPQPLKFSLTKYNPAGPE